MELKDKIKKLTRVFGVSGNEYEAAKVAAELLEPYCDKVEIDRFGNVTGYKSCGIPGAKKLMLDAHIDQIGFLVTEITDEGFLRFTAMGVDQRMLLGSMLKIVTQNDGELIGVVSSTPPHIQKGDPSASVAIADMLVDTGMTGEEARKVIRIGDYMYFANEPLELAGDVLCGKAFDDRACFCCILHALELLKDKKLGCDLIIVGSTKEEVGGHGAASRTYHTDPDMAIAIDVCHARTADALPSDNVQDFGGGPVIGIGPQSLPRYSRKLMEIARAKQIPYQVSAMPASSGTNAGSIQPTGAGYATAVVSLPLKYMHSPVEVLRLSDVKNVGRLLAEYAMVYPTIE